MNSWSHAHDDTVSNGDRHPATSLGSFLQEMQTLWGEPRDDPHAGHLLSLGKFQVLSQIGSGTFGEVYLARDPGLDCLRAIKVPTAIVRRDPKASRKFLDDARHLDALNHPNVVRVFEATDGGGLPYFVMEYCPVGSLSAWLRTRTKDHPPIPVRWAAMLVAQIADGVQHAHARKILHRDLKPSNILLAYVGAPDGTDPPAFCPKVTDFGLATRDDEEDNASSEGYPVGTLAYMSREAALGRRRDIGPACDVYGLGTILFELLAGRRLYPTADRGELLDHVLSDAPSPSIKDARPDVPREMQVICRSALEKDSRARYPSAAAMARDLRRFLADDPDDPPIGCPWWKRLRAGLRRRRRKLAGVGAASIAASLVMGVLWWEAEAGAKLWLQRVAAAGIPSFPGLLAERDPEGARTRPRLLALSASKDPNEKLSASVMLAGSKPECANLAYDRLLAAEAHQIHPLAIALKGRMADFAARLERDTAPAGADVPADEAEIHDRRRANAATALMLIGRPRCCLRILDFAPDPQARSFLIHTLGPAGVPPKVLFDELQKTPYASVRLALLQALGEVPDISWDSSGGSRKAVTAWAWRLYEHDPHPGVHGSAKWLLLKWDHGGAMAKKDSEIGKEDKYNRKGKPRPGFGWRITPTGLTMVTVDDPELGRPIEVSDCEITVAQYRGLREPNFIDEKLGPHPDSPVNRVDFGRSAEFCNWLTVEEAAGTLAYEPVPWGTLVLFRPIEDGPEPTGYRLPLQNEFRIFSRAGTSTRCYHGHSTALLRHYALAGKVNVTPRMKVARLKPNDLGLFDTLGNLWEWTRKSDPIVKGLDQAVPCGGSFSSDPPLVHSAQFVEASTILPQGENRFFRSCGFRVVRDLGKPDVRPRPDGPPARP